MPANANAGRSGAGPPSLRENVKTGRQWADLKVSTTYARLDTNAFLNTHALLDTGALLDEKCVRCRRGVERLTKAAEWQRARILRGVWPHEQVDVTRQIEMLKAIVEHVNRASQPALGDASSHIPAP